MENSYVELLKGVYSTIRPLGFKKEDGDFRLYMPDGLCKIINFQRNKFNLQNECRFTINAGAFFGKENQTLNKRFTYTSCQLGLRQTYLCESYSGDKWWNIDGNTDLKELYREIVTFIFKYVLAYLDNFKSKVEVIKMIIEGNASEYSDIPVMNFKTARLLTDMGYVDHILPMIRDIKKPDFEALCEEITAKAM